jgi:hypothetical protein
MHGGGGRNAADRPAPQGEGICLVIASRPVADFVLIDANSRGAYTAIRGLPGILKETVPLLPSRSVRRLALDLLKVSAIGPEIEVALEKCQGAWRPTDRAGGAFVDPREHDDDRQPAVRARAGAEHAGHGQRAGPGREEQRGHVWPRGRRQAARQELLPRLRQVQLALPQQALKGAWHLRCARG